eukprot:scaffold2908_cov257-Pinguiococcus_pyrenoidosus.AAC.8
MPGCQRDARVGTPARSQRMRPGETEGGEGATQCRPCMPCGPCMPGIITLWKRLCRQRGLRILWAPSCYNQRLGHGMQTGEAAQPRSASPPMHKPGGGSMGSSQPGSMNTAKVSRETPTAIPGRGGQGRVRTRTTGGSSVYVTIRTYSG